MAAAAAAAAVAAAVGAGLAPPGADELNPKEQLMMYRLREKKHVDRMSHAERAVPKRTKNKMVEKMIFRFKKVDRSRFEKENVHKQELIEVMFNNVADKRAEYLFALDAGQKKKTPVLSSQLFELVQDAQAKRRQIGEMGFIPPMVPRHFHMLPTLLD